VEDLTFSSRVSGDSGLPGYVFDSLTLETKNTKVL